MAWPARLTLLALGLICLTPIAALMALGANAPGSDMASLLSDPVILRALRFTLLQAGLSTLLSVIVALPVLYALRAMRPGYVTGALRSLFALPLVLPQIVAALAIVGVYGQAGWVADSADFMGLGWPSIYGLPGVVLAHVFFNMPLIVRVLDQALDVVPAEYRKTAAQIGMGPLAEFRLIDWPAMAPAMRGGAALVFLLCATSFTIVLVLGGGPRSTTLEVAIYQALTFDFDVRRAVVLVLMQVALGATVVFALSPSRIMDHGPMGVMGANPRFGGDDASSRMKFPTYFVVFAAGVFVGAPFLFVVIDGLSGDLTGVVSGSAFLHAASTSAAIGVCSAVLACAGAIALSATAVVPRRRKTGNGGGLLRNMLVALPVLMVVFPPLVLSAGWFLTLRSIMDPFIAAPLVVVVVNAAMALPFVARIIGTALMAYRQRYGRLEAQLGLRGMARFRLVFWPVLRLPLVTGFAFAFALSLGDFGVVAVFGSDRLQTLPFLIYANLGSYRTNDAATLALALTAMVFAIMAVAEYAGRRRGKELS